MDVQWIIVASFPSEEHGFVIRAYGPMSETDLDDLRDFKLKYGADSVYAVQYSGSFPDTYGEGC